uniref:F-box domain-containing protein n=1 Tax=Strongyloides papillosus TaxID=174720 RepID=A0A0N5BMU1_STREA
MVLTRSQVKKSTNILEYSKGIFKKKSKKSVCRQKSNKDVNSNSLSITETIIPPQAHGDGEISPAEVVGNEDNLMSYIIKMIPNPEERKNLSAVSRRFYLLCNAKKNYVPFLKYLDRKPPAKKIQFPKRWSKHQPLILFSGNSLAISLPTYHSKTTKYLKKNKNIIVINRYKITNLEIESFNGHYMRFFDGLRCFENVETVTFNPLHPLPINFKIFNKFSGLKPKTLRFMCSSRSSVVKPFGRLDEIVQFIPRSVECIHLCCAPHEIDWIFAMALYIPERHFDTLVLSQHYLTNLLRLSDSKERMVTLTRCFKNVKFCINQSLSYNVVRYFMDNSWIYNTAEGTNSIYYTKISLYKNPNIRFRPSIDELVPQHFNNEYGFLNFEYFCLTTNESWTKPPPFYRSPFAFIVGMMRNLVTLEVTMKVFKTATDMELFIGRLNPGLKNIKITNCEKIGEKTIEVLAERCKKINNISLESLNPSLMAIQSIIDSFEDLKGLSIYFCYDHNMLNAFTQLVGVNDLHSQGIAKWPAVDFLHIVFDSPQARDKAILKRIEKFTPRRCGRFIIKYHPKTKNHHTDVSEIIIHKSPTHYLNFIKLFTPPCWIKQ